jgi:hypothetical protein
MAATVSEAASRWSGRRTAPRPAAVDQSGPGRGRGCGHAGADPAQRHPLVAGVDADKSGLSKSTIGRIWRDFGLKPHRADTFTLSTDPLFIEKVVDVVGLYHNPPERAVVLCVDEKGQVQALDRSQPVLAMMPGMPGSPESTANFRRGTLGKDCALAPWKRVDDGGSGRFCLLAHPPYGWCSAVVRRVSVWAIWVVYRLRYDRPRAPANAAELRCGGRLRVCAVHFVRSCWDTQRSDESPFRGANRDVVAFAGPA